MAFYPCVINTGNSILSRTIRSITSDINYLGYYGLAYCLSLTDVNLPNLTTIDLGGFQGCYNITTLDFKRTLDIRANAFNGCQRLATLILRGDSVSSIANATGTINNTSFATNGVGGKLYVPQSLISEYQADSVWSQLLSANPNNQILAIEGSPYEN